MPTSVILQVPGTSATSDDYPNEIFWSFSVIVDGQAGLTSAWFPAGTSESTAASNLYAMLAADPGKMEGVASTGGAGGSGGEGSASTAGSGVTSGPGGEPDNKDDKIPKMKTYDGI